MNIFYKAEIDPQTKKWKLMVTKEEERGIEERKERRDRSKSKLKEPVIKKKT